MATLEELAFHAEQEIGRTRAFFPVLPRLGNVWAARRPWNGRTIGLNLHLTTLTAALVKELALGGARCVVSSANPATTDPGTVQLLRNAGVEVFTGGGRDDRHERVLDHQPSLLVDAAFDLVSMALDRVGESVRIEGAVVTSRTGIDRLRQRGGVPFPVVNLVDGRLQDAIENRVGIGQAVWRAVGVLTGMQLAGRRVAVVGYGPVGRGLAAWARHTGMAVEVVETDPIRRLFAHYDGYATPTLDEALRQVNVLVTATGRAGIVSLEQLQQARDGLVLLNAGTGGSEIDVGAIRRAAEFVDHVDEDVVRYKLDGGPTVFVLGDGHPLNIVLNSGSPEPVLLQNAVVGLALAWLVESPRASGEIVVPDTIESHAATLALAALERPEE